MLFDSHSHVNFAAFGEETDEVIKRSLEAGVWMANIGTSLATSKSAVAMAARYDQGVYAAIGLHPGHTWQDVDDKDESPENKRQEFSEADYAALLSDKVVAVGEIGLDYFRMPLEEAEGRRLQKKSFVDQLHFAQKHKLPVVIHCRDAYEDTLDILHNEYEGAGVIHSFTGDWPTAKKFLDFGFYAAFNGILTFDKTGRLAEVVEKSPFDRILTETDAPYLAPPPYRGKRNEPLYVKYIAEKISEIRKINADQVAEQTFSNACALFQIKNHVRP